MQALQRRTLGKQGRNLLGENELASRHRFLRCTHKVSWASWKLRYA